MARLKMGDSCGKSIAVIVMHAAAATAASPAAASEEDSDAFRGRLGTRWTKQFVNAACAHRSSGLVRRGLSGAGPTELAHKLLSGLLEMRSD